MLLRHTRKSSVLQMAAPNLETGVPRETRQGHLAGTCHWNHLAAPLIILLTDWSTKSWLRNELDELWRSTLFGGSTLLGIHFHEPLCLHSRDKREIHSPWFCRERRGGTWICPTSLFTLLSKEKTEQMYTSFQKGAPLLLVVSQLSFLFYT